MSTIHFWLLGIILMILSSFIGGLISHHNYQYPVDGAFKSFSLIFITWLAIFILKTALNH